MRLLNALFTDESFYVDKQSLGYVVRDIINMNWWNTSGVLIGYKNNKRITKPFTEDQKRIAVQLKEFYRYRVIATKDERKLKAELSDYIAGKRAALKQLGVWSMRCRANPSQYFTKNGEMTWVDCTSRATYAAKYVFQNGYVDFDGVCRLKGAQKIIDAICNGVITDLGVTHLFEEEDDSRVKGEIFSQKEDQLTVEEWVERLKIKVLDDRAWIFERIKHVRTDPYKKHEAAMISLGTASGVNECLYGFHTAATKKFSNTNHASHASRASRASDVSAASAASHASRVSNASHASHASDASHASAAGATRYTGDNWANCSAAITKPDGLEYPLEFRKNIFAMAGNWKINKTVADLARLGWFDPFMGHGTSPLYAARNGIKYLGFDTNERAFKEYLHHVQDAVKGHDVEIRLQDSTIFQPEMVEKFDLCYTSPPYFNFEEYGGNTSHYDGCSTYDDFHEKVSLPVLTNVRKYLIDTGILALQLSTNKKEQAGWQKIAEKAGWELISSGETGREKNQYSALSKRGQGLLVFKKAPLLF